MNPPKSPFLPKGDFLCVATRLRSCVFSDTQRGLTYSHPTQPNTPGDFIGATAGRDIQIMFINK